MSGVRYWVVVSAPDPDDEPTWTPEDAVRMFVGATKGEAPAWLFNRRRGRSLKIPNLDLVQEDDRVLLFTGANYGEPASAFLAHAVVDKVEPAPGKRFRILLKRPLDRLAPVRLEALRASAKPELAPLAFQKMYRSRHGPLNDLGAYPGKGSAHPGRDAARWGAITAAGLGDLAL